MKDKFKEKSKSWDTNPWKNKLAEEAYFKVKEIYSFNADWHIADIGGGTGLFTLKFANDVAQLTVIDTSESMLHVLREKIELQKIENVNIIYSELKEGTLVDESIDLMISMLTLHHIEHLDTLFRHVYRALKATGKIAFVDLLKEDGDFHSDDAEYIYDGFEPKFIDELLSAAGFTNIQFNSGLSITRESKFNIEKEYPMILITAEKFI